MTERDTTGLAGWNAQRSEAACARNSKRALGALMWTMGQPAGSRHNAEVQNRAVDVLSARAYMAGDTLAELAGRLGMTKHTYSARLRRAIEKAEKAVAK